MLNKAPVLPALCVFLLFNLPTLVQAASICQPDRIDASARVRHVVDGDTLVLSDERSVRLIGMNTPEIGHGKRRSEAFGDAARLRLIQLIAKHDHQVKLRYGKDKFDRHGRLLAHVFAGDENVTEVMLRQGLAVHVSFSPNLWQHKCYQRAENEARFQKRRIWRLPFYHYPPVQQLSKGGFHMIQGDVTRVSLRGKRWEFKLSNRVTLSISKKNRRYFDKAILATLLGKRVFVRGWFRKRKKRFYLGLKHPDMIKVYPVSCLRQQCPASQARALMP